MPELAVVAVSVLRMIDRFIQKFLFYFVRAGLEQLYEGMLLAALSQHDEGQIRVSQENV